MGQQQSAEEKKPGRTAAPNNEQHKKVGHRVSVQKTPPSRPPTVGVAPSHANATAQTNSQQVHRPALQQYLDASPPNQSVPNSAPDSQDVVGPTKSLPIPATTQSDPMDVPMTARSKQGDYEQHYDNRYPVSVMRPPRLPLPIAGVPTPDSPPLLPVDKNDDQVILHDDIPAPTTPTMRRHNSMQSTTTQDEEEIGDELQAYGTVGVSGGVPTTIRWNHSGEKVYVTGTFASWERKYKLHRNENEPGMSTVIDLPPGTHHLKFIVDGEMKTNPDLPTAVDYNAVLVNYVEISVDELPRPRRESDRSKIIYPAHPPLVPQEEEVVSGAYTGGDEDGIPEEPQEEEIPMGDYRQLIPQALIDMDLDEQDLRYQDAVNVISDVPGPPSLPMFLAKSILNGNLPLKDDSSVLPLPNHTVLNHLATSSVKNGILATSVTTRYRKKYVTTIMYKPVRAPPGQS